MTNKDKNMYKKIIAFCVVIGAPVIVIGGSVYVSEKNHEALHLIPCDKDMRTIREKYHFDPYASSTYSYATQIATKKKLSNKPDAITSPRALMLRAKMEENNPFEVVAQSFGNTSIENRYDWETARWADFCSCRYRKFKEIAEYSKLINGNLDTEKLHESYESMQKEGFVYPNSRIKEFCFICLQPMVHALDYQMLEADYKQFLANAQDIREARNQLITAEIANAEESND
jgi:hypothetical protein